MTIGVAQHARYVPFSGNIDPALPNAVWLSDVFVTGDGSGGVKACDTILTEVGDPDDVWFSLEQVAFQHDRDASVAGTLLVLNQRNLTDPATPIVSTFVIQVGTGAGDGRSGPLSRDLEFLPYFIGNPPSTTTQQLFLRIQVTNSDLIALRTHLWGYRWGPGAFDTPSGPRRPAGSVFGP